jgi:hypothetical protein
MGMLLLSVVSYSYATVLGADAHAGSDTAGPDIERLCSCCALTKGADDAHRLFAVELDSKDNAAERAFASIRLINKYFSA